ncbi:MAG: alpha/beta hydrolase [Gemmatimonadetes bacterium]|nr:alpha/beta hydrolase [Gemmatimonadota bacterium]
MVRRGWVTAVVFASGWGALAGVLTPRTPQTTASALTSIIVSLAVGVAAGLLTRSRWAILVVPVVFAVSFEIARIPVDGPTVDTAHFSTYGVFALVVGRGFHALLSLLPMAMGAAWGALAQARRHGHLHAGRGRSVLRWTAVTASVVLLLGLTIAVARSSSTAQITGADGRPVPASIAELTSIDVNGHELGLMIRGHDTANPVLLFLAGGPGGSELGAMRNHLPALEEHFTVATLDQRGTGTSYPALDPTDTYTLQAAIADAVATTNYLRSRFGVDRVLLVGQSWGTILGVLTVRHEPTLYSAFVGAGQMVSPLQTDRIFYTDTLAWARTRGQAGLATELEEIGPPPYTSMLDYETALSYEHEVYPYDHTGNSEGEGGFSENFLVPEYTLVDQVHLLAGFMDTFAALYPRIQDVDLRRDAPTLEVPVFFVQGAHEAPGRAEPFSQWYAGLTAPTKELVVLDRSGHRPLFEQPDEFVEFMTTHVQPAIR